MCWWFFVIFAFFKLWFSARPKHYPSLCHAKRAWVDAKEKHIFGCCTVRGDILSMRCHGIFQRIIDMTDSSSRKLYAAQLTAQLQFHRQKFLGNCETNCGRHTSISGPLFCHIRIILNTQPSSKIYRHLYSCSINIKMYTNTVHVSWDKLAIFMQQKMPLNATRTENVSNVQLPIVEIYIQKQTYKTTKSTGVQHSQ